MYSSPDGRHIMPIANSKGKCLIENWVEERAAQDIDGEKRKKKPNESNMARLLKDGHEGLLSVGSCSHVDDLTTHLNSYRTPQGPPVRLKGSRTELLERMLYAKARKELEDENQEFIESLADKMRSVTSTDFGIDTFVPMKPAPTAYHDYVTEQPVTIWTEHRDRVQGVSQSKPTFDSPFRRNTAFTRPLCEAWDPEQVKPYEADHVPNM